MQDYSLTEKTSLSRPWCEALSKAFDNPNQHVERLCDLAEKHQALNMAMDWEKVNLNRIPMDMRQGLANMFAQFHYGEIMGVQTVSKMVGMTNPGSIKRCLEYQVIDESRHVQWLSMLMNKLECEGKVNSVTEELMHDIYHSGSLVKIFLGIHVFIEGMAHSYCMQAANSFSNKSPVNLLSSSYRSAQKVIGEWLPDLIGRDESRHIAFGNYYLKTVIPLLTKQQRDELERFSEHLGSLMVKGVKHPDLLFAQDLDGSSSGARCLADINRQLDKIGIQSKIPDIYGVFSN